MTENKIKYQCPSKVKDASKEKGDKFDLGCGLLTLGLFATSIIFIGESVKNTRQEKYNNHHINHGIVREYDNNSAIVLQYENGRHSILIKQSDGKYFPLDEVKTNSIDSNEQKYNALEKELREGK